MIDVIHYFNEDNERPFVSKIDEYYEEVRRLLPNLPNTLQVYFADENVIPETGVGGFAYSRRIVTLSIDPDFKDKEKQAADIRPTIFHEVFHQYQGFTGEDEYRNAIDSAVYEGMATVFEREYEGTHQPYGDYSEYTTDELTERLRMLRELGAEYTTDEAVWRKWAFYNDDLKERWILYRTGTWIIDEVIRKTGRDVLDLKDLRPAEVLALFDA